MTIQQRGGVHIGFSSTQQPLSRQNHRPSLVRVEGEAAHLATSRSRAVTSTTEHANGGRRAEFTEMVCTNVDRTR